MNDDDGVKEYYSIHLSERKLEMFIKVLDGSTLKECSKQYGVSPSRIGYIVNRIKRLLFRSDRGKNFRGIDWEGKRRRGLNSAKVFRENKEYWIRRLQDYNKRKSLVAVEEVDE